ncbi:MAG: T9SS type A sorting domain-containing protein, partial [Candidatus Poribacteria bacterium]
LWDVAEQKQVAVLEGHTGGVNSVAFSRGGRWLASGSIDGTILLWEVNLPSPLGVKPGGKQPIILGGLKRTMLLQNFPNPFNPETWIPFKLAEEAPVTIRIYDAQGQLVRKLKLGQNPPGAYFNRETAAYWNGKNNCDESVASGVYLYQLRAGNFAMTKKMLLVK